MNSAEFEFQPQGRSAPQFEVHVVIPKEHIAPCESTYGSPLVQYKIIVTFESATTRKLDFVVRKRFSEIREMYDGLRVKFPELFKDERCPPFPAGAIFGLYNVTFIDTRRVAFEKLFQYIVSQKELKCSDKLSQFLEYSNLLKALSRQADQASQVPRHANPGAPRTSVHSDGSLDATLSFQEAILLIKSLRKERENEHAAFAEIRRLAELDFENEVQARVEESSPVCKICWLKSVEVTLVPCGHTVMCEKCATDCPGHRCPFCNVEFTQSLKVFF